MKAFKMGAFHMARDLDLPILPMTIKGTETILTPDGMDLYPGTAELVFHPPIPIEAIRDSSGEELRDRARAVIAAELGQP